MSIKNGKLIYHLTALDSFESIVNFGLMPRSKLDSRGIDFTDTADHEILLERERLDLSDYIPFHFHIHTAYDTVVKAKNNIDFVYLCVHRGYAVNKNFLILPIHPASSEQPQILSYKDGFKQIDWDVMEMTKEEAKRESIDERYHRQVRMAECLSPLKIPITDIFSVIVKDKNCKGIIECILKGKGIRKRIPFIDIKPNYF